MPSRGSYHVASREEGKAAQRDQSYRSCILALLIFFLLCIILIFATFPSKAMSKPYYGDQDDKEAGEAEHHHGHITKEITSTTEVTETITEKEVKGRQYFERYWSNLTSTKEPEVTSTTTSPQLEVSTDKSEFEVTTETYTEVENTTESFVLPSTRPNDEFDGSTEYTRSYEVSSETIEKTTSGFFVEDFESSSKSTTLDSTTNEQSTESIVNTTIEVTRTESTTYPNTESSSIAQTNSTELYETSTTRYVEGMMNEQEENTTDYISTTKEYENETTVNDVTTTKQEETTVNYVTTTKQKETTEASTTTTELTTPWIDEKECPTGQCKQVASRMLFFMNHSVDPCDDFYEYACGGFEADPHVVELNLENAAYERIRRQMEKEKRAGRPSLFDTYYRSCMRYENVDHAERIRLARKVLSGVGKFYTTADWSRNQTSFTELLAKLLLHHSALLFDVSPDLDEFSPKQFTIKIGPTTYKNPFDTEQREDPCFASDFEREQETVDLKKLYKEYKTCKNDTKKYIKSISDALTALGVFNELNNTYNISQYVQTTVINIDLELVQKIFTNYPSKEKIREAYLMKNYTYVSVNKLESTGKLVNWTQLIHLLTRELVLPQVKLQVYFYEELIEGLRSLEDFRRRDALQLNNALLGLYAHNLYQEFVVSKHRDAKEHCLRVASNLLIPEASSLYISSFSNNELAYMNRTIHSVFDELKETLKLKTQEAKWAAEEGLEALIKKIDDLKVAVPDISYFKDNSTRNGDEIYLTDNYFENSVTLMRRYRTLIYAEFVTDPGHPEQIWTHYATPFQSKGLAIYGLNLVVIPYGVIDWSTMYSETSFDYLLLATLGNVIAREIAHHFDANGIYYWNGTRETMYTLLNVNQFSNSNFEDYINCQKNILYQQPMDIVLPATGQTVYYEISQLTLNERLSETMGLRLAYDTLDRLRSRDEIRLPWLKVGLNQLFYLAYAQMHCTKLPLTSSYKSLYEDEQLPSRIRIFVSASNNKLLGEAWNCPDGSRIIPSYTCSVFPYLQFKDSTLDPDSL